MPHREGHGERPHAARPEDQPQVRRRTPEIVPHHVGHEDLPRSPRGQQAHRPGEHRHPEPGLAPDVGSPSRGRPRATSSRPRVRPRPHQRDHDRRDRRPRRSRTPNRCRAPRPTPADERPDQGPQPAGRTVRASSPGRAVPSGRPAGRSRRTPGRTAPARPRTRRRARSAIRRVRVDPQDADRRDRDAADHVARDLPVATIEPVGQDAGNQQVTTCGRLQAIPTAASAEGEFDRSHVCQAIAMM